jgi:DNA sulfur modification protein DndC
MGGVVMSDNGKLIIPKKVRELIDLGALFVINSSGGKDSQCMTIKLSTAIPKRQLVIIHSHLPEVEWDGVKEHIEKYNCGIPVHFTQSRKTFFEMVEHRKMFPSPANRQCTSDLKRGPIQKFINNYAKDNGFYAVVNCMGLRAEESPGRAKHRVFRRRRDLSCSHRNQFEWLPIHKFTINQVWNTITLAGQRRHFAYDLGMSRLSCAFCIMASKSDLKIAAQHNPELLQRYIEAEERLGFTMNMSRTPLKEIVNS